MNGKRYSRQRELIYEAVLGSDQHPTAEMVFQWLKPENPSLSLGTVYRNLRQLADEKKLLTLETEKKTLHFDADLSPHMHFICNRCGAISDLFLQSDLGDRLSQQGYTVDSEKTVLYGLCPTCACLHSHPKNSI